MRRAARPSIGKQTTLRHVWLASLGATIAAPRGLIGAADRATALADAAASRARRLARDGRMVLRGAAITVGERLAPLRAVAEGRLATGVFAVLSAFEQPSPLPRRAARRGRSRR